MKNILNAQLSTSQKRPNFFYGQNAYMVTEWFFYHNRKKEKVMAEYLVAYATIFVFSSVCGWTVARESLIR
jgi:hypothetical protein